MHEAHRSPHRAFLCFSLLYLSKERKKKTAVLISNKKASLKNRQNKEVKRGESVGGVRLGAQASARRGFPSF